MPLKNGKTVLTVLSIILISFLSIRALDDGEQLREAEEELLRALESIREAEAEGCSVEDLSGLVRDLNSAVSLLDEAAKAHNSGRDEEAGELASRSKNISAWVLARSRVLSAQAAMARERLKVMLVLAVPLAALLTSLTMELTYSWWLEFSRRRFMRMRIRLSEED